MDAHGARRGDSGAALGARADENEHRIDEAAFIASARIRLQQAITTAEQAVGGRAVETGIEDRNGALLFEVKVVKATTTHKVLVDPQSGNVVGSSVRSKDGDEDGESDDD